MIRNFDFDDISISWNKLNKNSIEEAQHEFNEYFLKKDFLVSQNVKDALALLQRDTEEFYTSICNSCGDKQSKFTHMSVEHMSFSFHWGYDSNKDCEKHSLTLCEACYDKYVLNTELGKFVKIESYYGMGRG